jgi:hypothetical protein
MIPEFTTPLFLQCLDEWGRYVERFKSLSPQEQADFLKGQGYASVYDLLAHAGVWWEEAEGIIRDALENRERPSRKYDFDEFNAASLARFKDTSTQDLLAWVEAQRQRMIALVSPLTVDQLKIRRVHGWLDAVLLGHLKEHCVAAPRFLVLDTLEREWGAALESFQALPQEQQKVFIDKQGFARPRDLVAHIIAWWEDGLKAIDAITKDLSYRHPEKDTDGYNAEAVKIFSELDEAEVWKKYESTRQSLIELVINLPEDIYNRKDVQEWLKADVIEHYYEHAM